MSLSTPNQAAPQRRFRTRSWFSGFASASLLAIAASVGITTSGWSATAQAAPPPVWQRQVTPGPTGSGFRAISCTKAKTCVAVGSVTVGSHDRAVAETETAGTWRVDTIALPSGRTNTDFWGVSCNSVRACVAVGTSGPLGAGMPFSEVLRGTTWKIVTTAKLAGVASANLNAVSCASATDCRAVGSWSPASGNGGTLVEVYNGSGWILDKTPPLNGSGYLSGVSCLPATMPALCTAVGSVTVGTGVEPLVEQANGYHWRVVSVPKPSSSQYASLASISCPQPTSCVAVGSALVGQVFRSFSEIENLLHWTIATAPTPLAHSSDNLLGVSCPLSIGSCRAVGFYGTAGTLSLAEAWNGHRWAIQTSSTPPSNLAELLGVSCVTVNLDGVACTAAGEYQGNPMGPSHPLAEHN